MADTLAPLPDCPFCGKFPGTIRGQLCEDENGLWFIWCNECSAEGPAHETGREAVEYWCRRSDPVRDAALEACQAFVDRFDSGKGLRADTDHVAGLMRAALAREKGTI